MIRKCGETSWRLTIALCAGILAYCSQASLAAESIQGVVHDQTDGRPAAGDTVILFRHGQEMQEEARAKTDLQGEFTLELQNPGQPHLVRVIHQGVNYDHRVSAGDPLAIEVFDAAAKVQGVSGGIEIIRAGTNGNLLHVSDMIEIKNNSSPPMTQASKQTFEVYLPADAKIDSVLAAGPENIGTRISAIPAGGEPGHFTVDFPLRPGDNKFAFNYDLPYDGRAMFHTRNMYPMQQVAVMIPPTMTFTSRSSAFQILPVGNNRYRVEAAEQVKAGDGPAFEISGVGALPSMQDQSHAPPKPSVGALASPAQSTRSNLEPQAHNANASEATPHSASSASSSPFQWWALSASSALMLGTCGVLVWRKQRSLSGALAVAGQTTGRSAKMATSLVEALKEGLFQLEADRLQGAITGEAYASTKQALNETIEWALTRTEASKSGTQSGLAYVTGESCSATESMRSS
jgi:hypothetical protein